MKATIEVDRLKVEGERFPREKPEDFIRALQGVSNTSAFNLNTWIVMQRCLQNLRALMFVFHSTLDVGRSMFDVHLLEQHGALPSGLPST
jgi:hypothetical protein